MNTCLTLLGVENMEMNKKKKIIFFKELKVWKRKKLTEKGKIFIVNSYGARTYIISFKCLSNQISVRF